MEIRIRGKNIDVSPAIKDYIDEKVSRLDRYFEDEIRSAEVELIVEKNPSIHENKTVEITLFTRGPLIRASETSTDLHASADRVTDKLERQIKKYKDRVYSSSAHRMHNNKKNHPPAKKTEAESGIVRVKQMEFKPMTPEEATLQMDLLAHNFFVFTNSDTAEINVVYKRRDQNYGLIEPA
ncbi:MAG TPA: ribosome-associated translation inhibitor RaiA [Actinobacteria bacterium]|nr:ribosome-associated translation inhibitor RaiA [Actinomycetota bacterium]